MHCLFNLLHQNAKLNNFTADKLVLVQWWNIPLGAPTKEPCKIQNKIFNLLF
jgi:hypothetical protein